MGRGVCVYGESVGGLTAKSSLLLAIFFTRLEIVFRTLGICLSSLREEGEEDQEGL